MLDHLPGAKEETELIAYIKELIPELRSTLKADNWEVVDRAIIQIKSKAKTLGLEPAWYISTEVTELWEMLWAKVEEVVKSHGITNIPTKEMFNILCAAFARYPEETMTMGLKDALKEWLERWKR